MKTRKVEEIVLPYEKGIPVHPAVTMEDKIIHAVELMVNHDLNKIAVVRKNRPIAMVRLQDALQKLGLENLPLTPS